MRQQVIWMSPCSWARRPTPTSGNPVGRLRRRCPRVCSSATGSTIPRSCAQLAVALAQRTLAPAIQRLRSRASGNRWMAIGSTTPQYRPHQPLFEHVCCADVRHLRCRAPHKWGAAFLLWRSHPLRGASPGKAGALLYPYSPLVSCGPEGVRAHKAEGTKVPGARTPACSRPEALLPCGLSTTWVLVLPGTLKGTCVQGTQVEGVLSGLHGLGVALVLSSGR